MTRVSRRATGPWLSLAPHLSPWKSTSFLAVSATAFLEGLFQGPKGWGRAASCHSCLKLFLCWMGTGHGHLASRVAVGQPP